MAENSRIEDLRKRYHENPRRFFAPLANEYRKAGFLDRALLLCQKHVPEQPDNMNGLVVFGQALFESGNTAEAREPFERALALDRENLIALRHLGDIARLGGDTAAAKQWYERVLELDRRNDDVLELLEQMGGADAAPAAPAPKPVGPGKTVVIDAQALADRDRREAEMASPSKSDAPIDLAAPAAPTAPAARPSKRASLLDIDFDFSETGEEAETVQKAEKSETVAAASDALVVETTGDMAPLGLEPTIAASQPAPLPELPAGDFELAEFNVQVQPLAGLESTEFTSDQAASEPLSGIADLPLLDEPEPVSASLLESPSARAKPRMTKSDMASLPLLADFGLEDDEPAPSARTSKTTPTFVTETMAALYVKQGHIDAAIGVYRQLVLQSPEDSGLRAKLVELERMEAADAEMPEFELPADASEPEPAAANTAMADVSFGDIALTGQGSPTPIVTPAIPSGPSAREFFAGFARRAAVAAAVMAVTVAADASDAYGEPVTAISSSVSTWPLDDLFGAATDVRDLHAAELLAGVGSFEGPDGGTGLDALFAEQAQPARRAVPRASEMLKFDQFFQAPGTAGPAAESMPAPDLPAAGPGDDDLDQFHGWLKGLKQ